MLQHTPDIVAAHVRQQGVAVLVVEQRLVVIPQALVGVHAGAVVTEERLGHERRRIAVAITHVLDDVLVLQDLIGHAHQRPKAHVNFGLAGGTALVVVDFDLDARLLHLEHDFTAQILQLVHRRDREVALLVARSIAEVGGAIPTGVPDTFVGINLIKALAGILTEADGVEDVELHLRSEIGSRGNATFGQEGFSFFRDEPRIARVALHRAGLDDVADDAERRDGAGGVQKSGVGVRQQQHVGLVDLLETTDRRSVEANALAEELLREFFDGNRKVLPQPRQVDELEVDHLDLEVFGLGKYLLGRGLGFGDLGPGRNGHSEPYSLWCHTDTRSYAFARGLRRRRLRSFRDAVDWAAAYPAERFSRSLAGFDAVCSARCWQPGFVHSA